MNDEPRRMPTKRVTRPRILLSRTMAGLARFATAQEIAGILREQGTGIGTATVYRNLQLMASAGELDTLHLNGETLYRECSDHSHHHHIVCRECGRTIEIEIPGLERWIRQAAHKVHFTEINHDLEIFGLCEQCAKTHSHGNELSD